MSRRRLIIIVNVVAVIVVAILLFLIWPRIRPGEEAQAPAPTATPVIVTASDVARAQLVPARFANLSFATGGVVAEILVAEGDDVDAGDPLLRLHAAQQEAALAQAQARLAAAETDLRAAEAGLAAAEADVRTAELGVQAAEAQLSLVRAGASAQEIAAAEENIAAARAGVVQAGASRDASLEVAASEIRAAEADVAAARAEVEELEKTYDDIINACFDLPDGDTVCPLYGPIEENTRAQLEAARLDLASAQAGLDALNAGASSGQRQAASGAVTIALAEQAMAEAEMALLLAGPTGEEVRQAEVQVAQAEARVEQAEAAVERAQAAVAQAEGALAIAQADVSTAQTALAQTTLPALFAGTVSRVDVKLGQQVNPGAPVVVLANFDDWLVETTDLSEQNVAEIEIGARVDVTVDAIPGETLHGEIVDIDRVFQREGGQVIYRVTVDLEERTDLPLRWGMSADVDYGAAS